jgi:ribosomal protein S18 acetylase RimI-like enzyme
MIRPTVPADVPRLIELTAATGFFRPEEVETLGGILDAYFEEPGVAEGPAHCCHTCELDGGVVGYIYFAEEEMVDRVWYVWWVAVDPQTQGRSVGRELLQFAEGEARRRGGRVMFVETSGLPAYERTRRFYLKNGYDREAVLRDYYRDGDDLVVFRKRLAA